MIASALAKNTNVLKLKCVPQLPLLPSGISLKSVLPASSIHTFCFLTCVYLLVFLCLVLIHIFFSIFRLPTPSSLLFASLPLCLFPFSSFFSLPPPSSLLPPLFLFSSFPLAPSIHAQPWLEQLAGGGRTRDCGCAGKEQVPA